MPTLWDFFHKSDEKQNSAHYKSYCKDCLDEELARIPIPDVNLDPAEQVLAGQDTFRWRVHWVIFGLFTRYWIFVELCIKGTLNINP